MRVLILSPYAEVLQPALLATNDTPIIIDLDTAPEEWPEVDFVVSFGYRHIIKGEILKHYKGKIINVHISILPFNRGACPNFWSWFDGTPKGVSIHEINEGIDTGDVIMYYEIKNSTFRMQPHATLATTYSDLIACGCGLFRRGWETLRRPHRSPTSRYQLCNGSYHKAGDEQVFIKLLGYTPLNQYNAQVEQIAHLGKFYRGEI